MTAMLAMLAKTATAAPLGGDGQLTCTIAAPATTPATFAVDLQTKKPGSAALVGEAGSIWARVGATSDVTTTGAGTAAFSLATGTAQYRLELAFTGAATAGNARARLIALGGAAGPVRYGQGFCTSRPGKPLKTKGLVRMPFDATPVPARAGATEVRAVPDGLTNGTCRLVGPDRRVHVATFALSGAHDNEASTIYRFEDADLVGKPVASGTGVRFHLVTSGDHFVTMSQQLDTTPPAFVQTSFERSGTWVDLTRDKAMLAWGECGPAPTAIVLPPQGKTMP